MTDNPTKPPAPAPSSRVVSWKPTIVLLADETVPYTDDLLLVNGFWYELSDLGEFFPVDWHERECVVNYNLPVYPVFTCIGGEMKA